MKKVLIVLSLTTLALNCFSQKEIKLEELKGHVNDIVIVKGKICGIRYQQSTKNSPTFIDVGGAYPNQLLTISFSSNIRGKLPYIPTEEKDKGGIAHVYGKVELRKNKPEIIVTDPKQLEILTDIIIQELKK